MPHDCVISEAGHVENARVGTDAGDALGQLPAAHARHYYVSNNQIDPACECLTDIQALLTIGGANYRVSVLFEHLARQSADHRLLLEEQDGFATGSDGLLHFGYLFLRRHVVDPRQIDVECSSLSRLTIDPDASLTLLYDPVDRGKAQTGSFAKLLGGEERLEDLFLRLAVHSAAVVRDGEHHIMAGLHNFLSLDMGAIQIPVARADRNVTAYRQSIARIHDQVHENLFNLPRVGLHLAQAWVKSRLQHHVFANQTAQHLIHVSDNDVEIEHAWLQHLFAAESQ